MSDDDPLAYAKALASEHEVVTGVLLPGPGQEPIPVLVAAKAQGGAVRLILMPHDGDGPQLMVAADDLRKIVNDPQR